ncbi:hypothetical protein [Saccharicrinis sp. GN24d3]|uniref:hypothetical protein n=1 Tax=Saccharicrinis sp. GN24d3 TaxID=3458416 RepID=UPI00403693BF
MDARKKEKPLRNSAIKIGNRQDAKDTLRAQGKRKTFAYSAIKIGNRQDAKDTLSSLRKK